MARQQLARSMLGLARAAAAAVPGMVPGATKRNVLVGACYAVVLVTLAGVAAP